MFLLLIFFAVASAAPTYQWTTGTGSGSLQYWAGNYNNASFFGEDSTYTNNNDGTDHFSPMRVTRPQVTDTTDTTLIPADAPLLNITKSIVGNFQDENYFYNFPFAASVPDNGCGGTVCPDRGTNAITTPAGGATMPRAGFFQDQDTLTFDFAENIGAFGLSFALRSTAWEDASIPAPKITINFGGTHEVEVTPDVGGEMIYMSFEPNVIPAHVATFKQVTITFKLIVEGTFPVPDVKGAWFVFNEVWYGTSGYNCFDNVANTAALTINLEGLPADTEMSYDGSSRDDPTPGTRIPDVGGRKVTICVPPGTPAMSFYDNGSVMRTYVDATDEIVCGNGHFGTLAARCSLDPRARLTIPLGCVPSLESGDDITISLFQKMGGATTVEFRTDLPADSLSTDYYVLATQYFEAKLNVLGAYTPPGSSYTCRKANSQQSPAQCERSTTRGTIAKEMQFRADCNDGTRTPQITNGIDISVSYNAQGVSLSWLLMDKQNQDAVLCVPALGTFQYSGTEKGVNNVTTDTADASCTPTSRSTRCNTTPLDLVTVLAGPETCDRVPVCGGNAPVNWVGGGVGGMPGFYQMSLAYNGVLFRNFEQNPYLEIRQCVLNLNKVQVSAQVDTSNPTVSTTLDAEYDCTQTEGETPGVCAGAAATFFSTLSIDGLNLPTGVSTRIDYVETSFEDGQLVCSTGTLSASTLCNSGGSLLFFCVPAIGSDPITRPCNKEVLPRRLEVVGQECPGGECFPNSNETCRPESEKCITVEVPLDCRNGCAAEIAEELCLWDMLALPASSQTFMLYPTAPEQTTAVRTVSGLGGEPYTTYVLKTNQRASIEERNALSFKKNPALSPPFRVWGNLSCGQGSTCAWNDYLSILDYQKPLEWMGEQVLEGVFVFIQNTVRPPFPAGKNADNCRQVSLLADQTQNYNVQYTWNGLGRVLEYKCSACPQQSCERLGSQSTLVRWFAVDPTTPTQSGFSKLTNGVGQNLPVDTVRYKAVGNPWSANPLEVCINSQTLNCTKTYPVSEICGASENQEPYQIYYTMTDDSSDLQAIEVKLGCDKQMYYIDCPADWTETGVTSCAQGCPNFTVTTYRGACDFVTPSTNDTFSKLQQGPEQTEGCAASNVCNDSWQALQPMINNVIDLSMLPDGSSDIPSTRPVSDFNQNMYRGDNYTNFNGDLTQRQNPFDLKICCDSCDATPVVTCSPPGPVGSSCSNPVVITEVGGYHVVFAGLYHADEPSNYATTVQELYRSESMQVWEEARPSEVISACDNEAYINAQWQERIESVRPTKCFFGETPNLENCGPSDQSRACLALWDGAAFVNSISKTEADNQIQLKFTYRLQFQAEPRGNVSWNTLRPHALLRPNKYAFPADKFYALEDNYYQMALNNDLVSSNSQAITCNPGVNGECVTKVDSTTPIELQGNLLKKKSLL